MSTNINAPINEPLFEDQKTVIKSKTWIMFFITVANALGYNPVAPSSDSGDSFLISQIFN